MITSDGNVEDFDSDKIISIIAEMLRQPGFFQWHCQGLQENSCKPCQSLGCPIADQ